MVVGGGDRLAVLRGISERLGPARRRCARHLHRRSIPTGFALLQSLEERFELPDGTPRTPGLVLTLLTLSEAMLNVEQDEPGFWDRF